MRATVWTILTLLVLGVGHWLPWLCCMPFMMMGADRGVEYLLKFQAGLTPPFVLGFLQFHGEDFVRHNFGQNGALEYLFFSFFGLFLWAVAGAIFWTTVVAPRFRAITGRRDREPEGFRGSRMEDRGSRREDRGSTSSRQAPVMEAILVEEEPPDRIEDRG